MEVSFRVNSSFTAGVVAGCALGAAVVGHVAGKVDLGVLCPAVVGGCTAGRKKQTRSADVVKTECPVFVQESKQCDEGKGVEEERANEVDAFWFTEGLTEVFRVHLAMKSILFDARSDFQRVQVIETEQFGRTLVMDGQTQSAKADEHIYHESLVHPAMLLHENPKSVFIGGGGEFATAREILRHKSVEKCVMVDIDKVACDICREQLPEWNDGAYEDPRFSIEYTDAKKWLEDTEEKFDVIIMDICDPIEAGPGYKLYTSEFYNFLHSRLNPGGIFVTQSGPGAVYNAQNECFTVIHNTLQTAFDVVIPYSVDIPSFGCNWGFNLGFRSSSPEAAKQNVLDSNIEEFNAQIEKRIMGGSCTLKFLDGLAFRGIVGIPKEIRQQCIDEDRVMTIDNPVFMYSG
uniref:thermospermine synthase n=1 Tax=Mucochytrium quahogii TaxID=96639 RepID=A0A7S2SB40_9STRA|mmetsp:Transcript_244/g.466  ORF Transcript_244/g.466 Transcript_244/m.466 type:complete len:403 (-) Transcript_244:1006-2214(-)|eukprot:CAMPEP_0203763674 /NCGR_PEP_ID=MMETSP0098-20131031/16626_1 /ASSEMBLY_ACC=CAM_ASM_000208 /TAXON_ID=96639 /ORGANISM=" , Strain NY0313808BC1" /LENGTH=402 /DNA_ID=CAMNT_0050658749 /DNA_START=38 /DNA_END=1246 /DNA_ORIENTATION=+